jgi:hypothetical protein
MELYKNIIILCLFGIILLGCNVLSRKNEKLPEYPIRIKHEDISEIFVGKDLGADTLNGGNNVRDIMIDLTKEDAEKLVQLNNNISSTEVNKVDDVPINIRICAVIKTSSNESIKIQYNLKDIFITYAVSQSSANYTVRNEELKQFFNDMYEEN